MTMHNLQEVDNISLSARSKQDQFIADITDYYTDFQLKFNHKITKDLITMLEIEGIDKVAFRKAKCDYQSDTEFVTPLGYLDSIDPIIYATLSTTTKVSGQDHKLILFNVNGLHWSAKLLNKTIAEHQPDISKEHLDTLKKLTLDSDECDNADYSLWESLIKSLEYKYKHQVAHTLLWLYIEKVMLDTNLIGVLKLKDGKLRVTSEEYYSRDY